MSPRNKAHQDEEESYFVSMTDLMVGVLFLFIIMLMAVALNLKHQQRTYEETNSKLTQADQSRREMLRDIKKSLDAEGVEVSIDEDTGVLRLPESLLFDRGKFELQAAGQVALGHLSRVLDNILPCYALVTGAATGDCKTKGGRLEAVFIEGHTDDVRMVRSVALGVSDNWGLSTARAIETFQQLTKSAPRLAEMQNDRKLKLLGVSGYADNRPAINDRPALPDQLEEWRTRNRRIDLRFLMATPDAEQLQKLKDAVQRGVENESK